ncbi:hypothetical protein ACRYCC_08140 [Actinomadura scrupuli]
MDETTRNDRARALRALHEGVLVLANVWDAAGACGPPSRRSSRRAPSA